MVSFDFQPRTRVIFGRSCAERCGHLARDLGFERILFVTDRGLLEAGHAADVQRTLENAAEEVFRFSYVQENPDSETVARGAAYARPHDVDGIVALGGGSVLDAAKGINFLLTNGGEIAHYRGYGKVSTPLLPMIGIPTTAGTGSDAQSYAVIADARTKLKMACGDPSAAFRIALLDPDLTVTAPRHVVAMAGVDAIAHAVETAVTVRRTPMSDVFCHQAWRMLAEAFERVLLHPTDIEARGMMQLGAHYAGMAIEQSMLGAAHACANPLTARFQLTHGLALSVLLPHVVRFNAEVATAGYTALLGSPRRRTRDVDAPETLARRLEDFGRAAGLPAKLSDTGVPRDSLPELAGLAAQQWTGSFNPRHFDTSGALQIYEAAY